jgi:hypothetical protein
MSDRTMQHDIPLDWQSSTLIPMFKGKGDPMECGSYRAIKLLEHAMKVVECWRRRLEARSRLMRCSMASDPGKVQQMFSLLSGSYRKNIRRRICIMLLLIWKRHLTWYRDKLHGGSLV